MAKCKISTIKLNSTIVIITTTKPNQQTANTNSIFMTHLGPAVWVTSPGSVIERSLAAVCSTQSPDYWPQGPPLHWCSPQSASDWASAQTPSSHAWPGWSRPCSDEADPWRSVCGAVPSERLGPSANVPTPNSLRSCWAAGRTRRRTVARCLGAATWLGKCDDRGCDEPSSIRCTAEYHGLWMPRKDLRIVKCNQQFDRE